MSYKYETASPDRYNLLKAFAKHNRREMTQSETILWKALRHELRAYRFRRQHPIGDYIADFVCLSRRLIVEVDGGYHDTCEQQDDDQMRTDYLNQKGFEVMRFSNEDVDFDVKAVISMIKEKLINIEEIYDE
jgi:very-short-patch-repair endonuclease